MSQILHNHDCGSLCTDLPSSYDGGHAKSSDRERELRQSNDCPRALWSSPNALLRTRNPFSSKHQREQIKGTYKRRRRASQKQKARQSAISSLTNGKVSQAPRICSVEDTNLNESHQSRQPDVEQHTKHQSCSQPLSNTQDPIPQTSPQENTSTNGGNNDYFFQNAAGNTANNIVAAWECHKVR